MFSEFQCSDLSDGGEGSLAGPTGSVSFSLSIYQLINKRLILLAAGMEAPLSLPSSPVSVRPLHLLLLLILTIAILTLLLFSYGAFPSGSILTINYV